jgi:hypothetical protein
MGLHNIDIDACLRRMADRRIEEAMEQGKFDNLAGMGQPLELEEPPTNENARMMWWALRIMKNNDFTPHEVVWRKQIDRLSEKLEQAADENELANLVEKINQLAHSINTLGTNAIAIPIAKLDIEQERMKFNRRQESK